MQHDSSDKYPIENPTKLRRKSEEVNYDYYTKRVYG